MEFPSSLEVEVSSLALCPESAPKRRWDGLNNDSNAYGTHPSVNQFTIPYTLRTLNPKPTSYSQTLSPKTWLLQVHVAGGDSGPESECSDEQICAALLEHLSLDAAVAFATPRLAPASHGAARATDRAAAHAAQRPSNSHRVIAHPRAL